MGHFELSGIHKSVLIAGPMTDLRTSMHGENDTNHMNLDMLQTIENKLQMWVNNVRCQKVRFIRFFIQTD
jgi:hypothetical protein